MVVVEEMFAKSRARIHGLRAIGLRAFGPDLTIFKRVGARCAVVA